MKKQFFFLTSLCLVFLPFWAYAQEGVINFTDAAVKSLCISAWDNDLDNELSYDEAASVTDLGTVFAGNTSIVSFDELQYFTSLSEIPAGAFKNCNRLVSFVLPPSIRTIGSGAFQNCYKLSSMTLPEGIETIDSEAFSACIRIVTLDIPETVVSIGDKAFYYCTRMTSATVHSPSVVMGKNVFSRCDVLSEMTIPAVLSDSFVPSTVTSLHLLFSPTTGYSTFCSGNAIDFSQTDGVTAYAVTGFLDGEVYLMEVTDVPAGTGVIVNAAPGVEYELFKGTGASLDVPNYLVGVQSATVVPASEGDVWNLVFVPSGESGSFCVPSSPYDLGAHEAYARISNETITEGSTYPLTVSDRLPIEVIRFADATVKSLCVSAWDSNHDGELSYDEAALVTDLGTIFAGNTSIVSFDELQYFTSLSEIPAGAFKNSNRMVSFVLPPSIRTIGSGAFQNCYKLSSLTLPEGLETIGSEAFSACIRILTLDIPETVVSIGDKAFYYCTRMTSATVHSPSVVMGTNVFSRCDVLSEMTIPAVLSDSFVPSTVTSLHLVFTPTSGYSTFSSENAIDFSQTDGVTAYAVAGFLGGEVYLLEVTDVPAGTGVIVNAAPGVEYELFKGTGTALEVPNYLVGVQSATVVPASEGDVWNLVFVPSEESGSFSVLSSPYDLGAHEAYVSISDETIKEGSTYPFTVSDRVPAKLIHFADATVKSLCVSAWDTDFDGELSCDEAALVTDLGTVFAGNTSIVSFDELQYFTSLSEIPAGAFKGCKGLVSVVLPPSVRTIGSGAFQNCYKLSSMTLPDGLETIGSEAFSACIVLPSIILPATVSSVGDKAFYYCTQMTSATILSPSVVMGTLVFSRCNVLSEMTIPAVLSDSFVPSTVTSLHLKFTPETSYSTFCSGNAIDFSQTEGVTAYVVSGFLEDKVYLMEVTDVPAGTGVIVNAASGVEYELSKGTGAELEVPNYLVGVESATVVPASEGEAWNLVFVPSEESGSFSVLSSPYDLGAHEAYVSISDETITEGSIYPFTVSDRVPVKVIHFADAAVKSLCVSSWDTDLDGELSYDEAASVTDLGTVFADNTSIVSFDELQYFTSLSEISAGAFKNCNSLVSLVLPSSIRTIGSGAFQYCYKLSSLTLPDGLETIGSEAFTACIRIVNLEIPETVVSIGDRAFYYCIRLKSVRVNSSSVVMGMNVFKSCNELTDMIIPAALTVDFVPSSVTSLTLFIKPNTVYSSFCSANPINFSETEGLKAYIVPVEQIGEAYLLEVSDVPAGTGVVLVGTPNVEYTVQLGSNNPLDQDNLLVGVQNNTVITPSEENNVNLILVSSEEEGSFNVLTEPTEIKAHEAYLTLDVNQLGSYSTVQLSIVDNIPTEIIFFVDENVKSLCVATWDQNGDGELDLNEASAVTDLGTVFKKNKTIGAFPELKYFTGLVEICDSAFSGSTVKSVVIPNSVSRIGNAAFSACYELASVELPEGLTTISTAAFSACTKLNQITLPETAVNLGERAFYYCTKLTSVNIPDGVETIPVGLFRNCTSLDSIAIPSRVKTVGDYAFYLCPNLKAVRMPVNLIVNSLPSTVERYYYYYTLPSEWSTFCSNNALGFSSSENVEAYVVSSYVDGTANLQLVDAVPAGTGLVLHGTPGTEVVFSKGNDVAPVNLLRGLLKPSYVKPKVYGETRMVLDIDNLKGLGFYPMPEDVVMDAYTAYLALPGDYDGDMVHISLGNYIVFADDVVKSLCVSNWDTNGDGELSMDEAAVVTSTGTVFSGNSAIKMFEELQYFTGLTEISANAFSGCTGLKSIIIPDNVTVFGENAFKNCRNLSAINLPEGLTYIGANCFNYCSTLESIVIPESVTFVGDNAFIRCNKLATVTVPAKLYVNSFPTAVKTYYFTLTLQEEYETLCSAYNLDFTNTGGLQAFTSPLYRDGKIKMNRLNNVPAGTGILVHGVVGRQYVMSQGVNASLENLFVGVLEETALSPVMDNNKVFCLMNGSQGYAFYPISTETALAANSAYLPLPESDVHDVDYVLMSLLPDIDDPVIRAPRHHEGIASSIDGMDGDSTDEWFTLTGAKLNGKPTQRGIYIHNGKKVSVK